MNNGFVFMYFFCIFTFILYLSNKLTGGSEGHADGVDDGSGSPGDGEEAARQSEDDKALWHSGIIFCILYFVCQSEDGEALWTFEKKFFVFCILYLHASARTRKPFGISRISFLYFHFLVQLLYFNRCCIFNCWCCFCFLQLFFSRPFGDWHFALLFL